MATKATLLVVDDNADNRELMAEIFAIEGFAVVTAASGEDALASAETHRPEIVFMDLAMPGRLDGYEATRRIKAHPLLGATTVIAVTAHAFPITQRLALEAGCYRVIVKPVDISALSSLIEGVLALRLDANTSDLGPGDRSS